MLTQKSQIFQVFERKNPVFQVFLFKFGADNANFLKFEADHQPSRKAGLNPVEDTLNVYVDILNISASGMRGQ